MSLFKLAKITAPVGIKGEIRVYSYLNELTRFSDIEEVFLDGRTYELENARVQKGMVVLKLSGIDDRNAAELLRDKELFADKNEVDLGEDNYFTDELIGCAVEDENGEKVGELTDIISNPAHDLYQITTQAGKSFLLPAVHEFILSVDTENRLIRVHLIEGLIS